MGNSGNIYQAIGKLFYAVAAVDNTVHPRELETIDWLIKKRWDLNKIDRDLINNQSSTEIIKGFNSMLQNKIPAYVAFKEFVSFKQANEQEFNPEIKEWIWQISDRITYSIAGKNKSEVIILSKLKNILLRQG